MRVTTEGLDLIKSFESCVLTAQWDPLGKVWFLGWGRSRGISEGQTCTQDQADAWLAEDVADFETYVANCVPGDTMSPNQFSAVVSFAYNVGLGQKGAKDGFMVLASGEPSTMRKCLLVADYPGAAAEFPKWDKARGVIVDGLLRRRLAEQALFLKGV